MRLRNFTLFIAGVIVLGGPSGHAEESRLRIEVSPQVTAAPAAVTVRAFVTPDDENRALQIVADSGSFYRSSMVPLDGANAAFITEARFKNLPGGKYEVIVVLLSADGDRTVDRREVTVTASIAD